MPDPITVMIARFPYGASEHPDAADWLVPTAIKARNDDRVKEIITQRYDDTPITMTRNQAVASAQHHKADLLLFLDSDQAPDAYLEANPYRIGVDPNAKPFWDSSFDFWWEHRQNRGPCLIAAPYMGPPPVENCYIFRWRTTTSDDPNQGFALEQWTREEAATAYGIEQVAALPTGLMMIDMAAFKNLKPPYFYYEWVDEYEQSKASTEDVTFTRDCSLNSVPCYVNWDAWAGHHKLKNVGRPIILTNDVVAEKMRKAAEMPSASEPRIREELMLWTPGKDGQVSRAENSLPGPIDPMLDRPEPEPAPESAPEPEPGILASRKSIGMRRPAVPASVEDI